MRRSGFVGNRAIAPNDGTEAPTRQGNPSGLAPPSRAAPVRASGGDVVQLCRSGGWLTGRFDGALLRWA